MPPSKQSLVDVSVDATVEYAFDLLSTKNVIHLPVYRLAADQTKVYVAIISALDLMKWVTNKMSDKLQLKDAIGHVNEKSRWVTFHYSDALVDVMGLLTESHPAVLVSGKDDPALLTQMDILRYLQAHNHHLGSILDETVPRLVKQITHQQVNKITFKATAYHAFNQLMRDSSLTSALPIVDDENYLLSDIGLQDVWGIDKARWHEPVLIFQRSHRGVVAPFTIHDRFTLSQIMAAMVLRKANRLWWIDQDGHIQGVVTPSDVLGFFLDDAFF
ncbi:hypothetical protein BC941DRAFT_451316 [Chlamydoabsidia padenii]|nr:hypothetical protein BC941DRAFT_451316 [Chlamydoabsidia padenii]